VRTVSRQEWWEAEVQPNGAVLGCRGLSYTRDEGGYWKENPQDDCLIIEADVHIGANCTIHRGGWRPMHISEGCRIGAQVNIGHNVVLGENVLVAPQATIAGSATVGKNVTIWQGAMIHQRVRIGRGAVIGQGAVVRVDVPAGAVVKPQRSTIIMPEPDYDEEWPPGC